MRTNPDLHVEWVEDEAVILDPTTEQLHYLNTSAALVYASIEEHGFEAGLDELRKRYSDVDGFEDELRSVIEQLVGLELLKEEDDA